jgi:hypothetical protein
MTSYSYDDALRYVRRQSRISTNSLADGLNIRWSLALDYLEEMKRRGIVGDMQEDGWWPVLRKEAFSTPRKTDGAAGRKPKTQAAGSPTSSEMPDARAATMPHSAAARDKVQQLLLGKLQDAIYALTVEREKNGKLRNNCSILAAECEAWKHRALAAEARIAADEYNQASEKRLEELRRTLSDQAPPDAAASAPSTPPSKRLFTRLENLPSD